MEPTTAGGLVSAVPALLFAGVISVGVAYTLQIVGQQRVDPTRAGIIVSLESVFAALGGWALLGERLSPAMLAGCGLMFLGMVSAQWRGRRRSAAAAAL
jgi:drug/metabolite transporter (DMT)-like permease